MSQRPPFVIFLVVGTLSLVTLLYAATLTFCGTRGIEMPANVAGAFKDVALVALGAIGALLTRTSNVDIPAATQTINSPSGPVTQTTPPDQQT